MSEFIAGLELHLPLKLSSKLFCSCPIVSKEAPPNTATCPTCLGHPGAKPVLNKKALDFALKLALALNCKIEKNFIFSRKTYFYPDLAKNYQISQFDVPIGRKGFIELDSGKKIMLTRIHLEEDPGALVHEVGMGKSPYVLVDYNRSGVPLCEIVTEPDINSREEAKEFLDKLNSVVSYLGIFDSANFVIKADTNISIKGGERVEVKNVTGSKNIKLVLDYELERQKEILKNGEKIEMETRGFDETNGTTFSLRKKETEEDYGFIADPDLVKVEVDNNWLNGLKAKIPELAQEKVKRFVKEFGLKEYDAKVLASNKTLSEIFEEAAKLDSKLAVRFVSRELMGILNYNKLKIGETKVNAIGIIGLIELVKAGKVSDKNAKESIIKYVLKGVSPKEFLEKNNLLIESIPGGLEKIVKGVVEKNKSVFDDYKQGNSKSLNFLIGQVMRKMQGKADARQVQKVLESLK